MQYFAVDAGRRQWPWLLFLIDFPFICTNHGLPA
jgi:hypothetical protein